LAKSTRSDMGVPKKKKEYAEALRLIREGWPPHDIATMVGVAYRTVLKWSKDVPPEERKYERRYYKAKELREQGWNRGQLARYFGVNVRTISKWLGVSKVKGVHYPREYREAIRLYTEEGWKVADIADSLSVSIPTVYRWVRDVKRGPFPPYPRKSAVCQKEKERESKKWEGWDDV